MSDRLKNQFVGSKMKTMIMKVCIWALNYIGASVMVGFRIANDLNIETKGYKIIFENSEASIEPMNQELHLVDHCNFVSGTKVDI